MQSTATEGRPDAKRHLPPLLQNIALSAASLGAVLLLCLAAELALRWVRPRTQEDVDDLVHLHGYSEAYGWLPQPGYRQTTPLTTINDAGFRGHEIPRSRTPGRIRVLMLGDSITFGYGVADDETSSSQMERLDATLEVVNLAVQGFGTDQALLRFEREGVSFQPDVAILNFCLANDFRDNGAQRAIYDDAYPKPYFTLEHDSLVLHEQHLALSPLGRLTLLLHRRSVLFTVLRQQLIRPPTRGDETPAVHPPAPEVTLALLRRFADVARARGIRPIVVLYPNLREFLAPSRRAGLILDAPSLEGLERVDLRPILEARGMAASTFDQFSLDGTFHPTPRGHRLVASILVERVTLGSKGERP